MMLRFSFKVLPTLMIIILLCSCENGAVSPKEIPIENASESYGFSVQFGSGYKHTKSSSPGIPITVDCRTKGDVELDLSLKFTCDDGELVSWDRNDEEGKVTRLGNLHITDFEDVTLYWNDFDGDRIRDGAEMSIILVNKDNVEEENTITSYVYYDEKDGYRVTGQKE